MYVYVFDLRDTTESVFQRRKVIQKHGDISVNSMKGVRNSGSRSNVSKSADPKNDDTEEEVDDDGSENGWRRKLEKLKKSKKKVGQLSFARAIDLADRVANPELYESKGSDRRSSNNVVARFSAPYENAVKSADAVSPSRKE